MTYLDANTVPSADARRAARLAALAGTTLDPFAPPGEVLLQICDVATEFFPASKGASVVLWDDVREEFTTAASSVPGQESDDPARRVRRSGGASRWIVDNMQPVIVRDTTDDAFSGSELIDEYGIGAYIGLPIVVEHRAVGVLYALDGSPRAYDEDDVDFMRLLSERAAVALVHARIVEEIEHSRERAAAEARIATRMIHNEGPAALFRDVAAAIAETHEAAAVSLLSTASSTVTVHVVAGDDGDWVRTYAEMPGSVSQLVLDGGIDGLADTAAEGDEAAEWRRRGKVEHVAAVPIGVDGRQWGVLTVIRHAVGPAFDGAELEQLRAVATHVAVTSENMRLQNETERMLSDLRSLYAVSSALSGFTSIDELLDEVVEVVAKSAGAERVSIFLVDIEERVVTHAVAGGRHRTQVELSVDFDELWDGLFGWALRNQETARSAGSAPDLRESPQVRMRRRATKAGSIVVVPLIHRGRPLGAVTIINDTASTEFGAGEAELLESIAAQMASAVAGALAYDEAKRLSETDSLTGLTNRRKFFEIADHQIQQARRYGRPLSMIVVDIDDFKTVNDNYGHDVGDQVIAGVGTGIAATLRSVDVAGRFGGEEFVILLPETPLRGSVETAERLRQLRAEGPIVTSKGSINVTISGGVAQLGPGENAAQLFTRADRALLDAKQRGRNRIVVADG